MRRTRLLEWSVGTVVGLAALSAVGGCDTTSGTNTVGAGPGSGSAASTSLSSSSTQQVIIGSTSSAHSAGPGHSGATGGGTSTSTPAGSTPSPTRTSPNTQPGDNATTAPATSANTPSATPTSTGGTGSAGHACSSVDLSLQAFEFPQITVPTHPVHAPGPTSPTNPTNSTNSVAGGRSATRPQQMTLTFTDVSHSACTLSGYPSVDFLRAGMAGPLSAPNSFAPVPGVTNIHLTPGSTASSVITFITNGASNPHGSRCDNVVAVRVYPPGSTSALVSPAHDSSKKGSVIARFFVCGHVVIVHAIQPIQPNQPGK